MPRDPDLARLERLTRRIDRTLALFSPERSPAPRWQPLRTGGELSEVARLATAAQTGVYAIREAGSGSVLYVGESHTASAKYPFRMWKTILRHLHGQDSFRSVGEWAYAGNRNLEIALWFTPAGEAIAAETAWIKRLRPLHARGR